MDRLGLVVITMSSGAMTEATVDHFATLVGFSGSSSFIECFQSLMPSRALQTLM